MNSILTVTTAADTHDLTVLDTVKEELGRTVSATDAQLTRWIHEASTQIASHCRRVFAAETVQEVFHGVSGADELILSRRPVTSITSVTEDDDTALAATYYEIEADTGLLYRLDGTGYRERWHASRVTVVYVGGYSLLGNLPRDIEAATVQLVARRAFMASRDPNLRTVQVEGVGSRSFWVSPQSETLMSDDIKALLAPYRNEMF